MLNFKSEVPDIASIGLTGDEATLRYPPIRGNISGVPQDDINTSAAVPSHPDYSEDAHDMSFSSVVSSHTGSGVAPAAPSTSGLQSIPSASLIINKKTFSPKSINRVKSLMSKENRVQTLVTVGARKAATDFNVTASQDEEDYDGDTCIRGK